MVLMALVDQALAVFLITVVAIIFVHAVRAYRRPGRNH